MRALLLVALLALPAPAAQLGETGPAPLPDMPPLPASAVQAPATRAAGISELAPEAVVGGPAAAALSAPDAGAAAPAPPDEASAADSLNFFDGASRESWERLERALLGAVGSDASSRAALWREGAAHARREDPKGDPESWLARAFASAHGLRSGQRDDVDKLLRANSTLQQPLARRLIKTGGRLFALTYEKGIHERKGAEWRELKVNGGTPFAPTQVRVVGKKLFVSSWSGVHALDQDGNWDSIDLLGVTGFAFVKRRLYAATDDGVHFWTGKRWRRAGLPGERVLALEESSGRLRATTRDGRAFVSGPLSWLSRLRSLLATGSLDVETAWRLDPEASPAARAAAAGLPSGARLALSGDERLGFSDTAIFFPEGAAWREVRLTHNDSLKASDVTAHEGVVHVATTKGVFSLAPMSAGWKRSMAEDLAGVPEIETASFPGPEEGQALWDRLEAAAREHLAIGDRGFASAWRVAAAAALREAPDAPLAEALTRALSSALRRQDAAGPAEALFSGEPMVRARAAALARGSQGVLAILDEIVHRFAGRSWERLLSGTGIRRVEERDGGVLAASAFGLHIKKDGATKALFTSSAYDFLPLAPESWLVAAHDGVWMVDGKRNLRMALRDRRVFRLIAHAGATYAATEDGLFVLRPGLPPKPVVDGLFVFDALPDGDGWLLATDQGLYELETEGGSPRWIPESSGALFRVLRPTRDGLLALGGTLALIRQDGRWKRAPESLQGASDVLQGDDVAYVAREGGVSGVSVVPRLPSRWRESLLADLASLVDSLSADAARAAAESKAGSALRDARGRSLLGP